MCSGFRIGSAAVAFGVPFDFRKSVVRRFGVLYGKSGITLSWRDGSWINFFTVFNNSFFLSWRYQKNAIFHFTNEAEYVRSSLKFMATWWGLAGIGVNDNGFEMNNENEWIGYLLS